MAKRKKRPAELPEYGTVMMKGEIGRASCRERV